LERSAVMLLPYAGREPRLHTPCFVAPGAHLIGDVELGRWASVWFNAVLRADEAAIVVGERSNLQDGVVLHTDAGAPCRIGADVTVGHNAVVHGATVDDLVLIGMGAVVLSHARIGSRSLVAAGALVTEGQIVPPESLVMGVPARVVRRLTDDEQERLRWSAAHYVELWQRGGWGS